MTFDLDLWPTDLNSNSGHLLMKDYLPTKFEAFGAKRSWVISCTRLRDTDIPTDIPTDMCKAICPSFFKGDRKIQEVMYLYNSFYCQQTITTKNWMHRANETLKAKKSLTEEYIYIYMTRIRFLRFESSEQSLFCQVLSFRNFYNINI